MTNFAHPTTNTPQTESDQPIQLTALDSLIECLEPALITLFVESREQLHPDLRGYVTPISVDEYLSGNVRLFLHPSLLGGFGITREGELVSMFSLPGAHLGLLLLEEAARHGARLLYCFDGMLPRFYAQAGFQEVSRIPWDDQYAPNEWNFARFGRPDVIKMARTNQGDEIC